MNFLQHRSQQHRLQAQSSSSEGEHPGLEALGKDLAHQYQSAAPFISVPQPSLFWSQESEQRQQQTLQAQQQLLKLHIRSSLPGHPAHKPIHDPQTYDGKPDGSQLYSSSASARSSSKHSLPGPTPSLLLPQVQPVFATQNLGSPASLPGLMVPVRIQTNVQSFGNAMYTSVSQLMASYGSGVQALDLDGSGAANMSPPLVNIGKPVGGVGGGFNLSLLLGQVDVAGLRYPLSDQQVNTGIPLSLTSGTISTTDASASNMVASKRMLSPTSSLERFTETKQQKRVKEERMYGLIVKEMSAVELSGVERTSKPRKQGRGPKREDDDSERMSSSPPLSDFPAKIAIPVRSPAPHLSDVPRVESFTPPLQIITDRSPASGGRDSPEELYVDEAPPRSGSSPEPMLSSNEAEDGERQPTTVRLLGETGAQQLFHFPSLRTISRVSWCFRSYTKPNSTPAAARSSVYSTWCVSSYNPNPLNLSTKAALALLRSKQRTNTDLMYTIAAVSPPSSGKLVSSVAWKLRFDQVRPPAFLSQLTLGELAGTKSSRLVSAAETRADAG